MAQAQAQATQAAAGSTPTAAAASATPTPTINRTLEIGILDGKPAYAEIEIRATAKGPELSICGTYGSTGGQCLDDFARITTFRPGWTPALRDRLLEVWRGYHLNGMQAACIHQRTGYEVRDRKCLTCGHTWTAPRLFGDTPNISGEPTEHCPACDTYGGQNAGPARAVPPWDPSAMLAQHPAYSISYDEMRRLERGATSAEQGTRARACETLYFIREAEIAPFTWRTLDPSSPAAKGLCMTPLVRLVPEFETAKAEAEEKKIQADRDAGIRLFMAPRRAVVQVREKRARAGHTRPTEHPAGILGKACGVCGYKYGSAWLYSPLPPGLIEEIQGWPTGGIAPGPDGKAPSPYDLQADRWLQQYGVSMHADHTAAKAAPWTPKGARASDSGIGQHWTVTLRAAGVRPFVFDFWNSQRATATGEPLRAYSALSTLAADRGYTDPDQTAADLGVSPSVARKTAAWAARINRWLAQVEERTPGATAALDQIQ